MHIQTTTLQARNPIVLTFTDKPIRPGAACRCSGEGVRSLLLTYWFEVNVKTWSLYFDTGSANCGGLELFLQAGRKINKLYKCKSYLPNTSSRILREILSVCEPGSPVAVKTIGNWYWIADEIESAGMVPRLAHARKAKLIMVAVNKTDKLDVRGLNRLQRNGTLPEVWIPAAAICMLLDWRQQ